MSFTTGQNKDVVRRFNREFIEQDNMESFYSLVAEDVVNHAAPEGTPPGPDSMRIFIQQILRKAFPDISVEIHDQVAEGDKVTSRKTLRGTHTGELMGIPPTGKQISIEVIDIIRLQDGRYAEHWGMSNFNDVVKELSGK